MDAAAFLCLALLPAEKKMCPVDNSDNLKKIKNVTASFLNKIQTQKVKKRLISYHSNVVYCHIK